jgi:hypothetical protein
LGATALISLIANAIVIEANGVFVYFVIDAGRVFNALKVYALYKKPIGVV